MATQPTERQLADAAQIKAMTPSEQAQLEELGHAVNAKVVEKLSERTQRTLGAIIALGLVIVACVVLLVVAVASKTASDANYKELISSVQPGTIVVAVIAALAGLATGIGLGKKE